MSQNLAKVLIQQAYNAGIIDYKNASGLKKRFDRASAGPLQKTSTYYAGTGAASGHLRKFIALEKIGSDEQRTVMGKASSGAIDDQGDVIAPEAIAEALPDFMKWANMREMHQAKAIGTFIKAEVNKRTGITHVTGKIVDPAAWQKVKEGVYKGFSVGGSVVKCETRTRPDGTPYRYITAVKLNEISLVDRPANPEAVIELWKATGVRKEVDSMSMQKSGYRYPRRSNLVEKAAELKSLAKAISEGHAVGSAPMERLQALAYEVAELKKSGGKYSNGTTPVQPSHGWSPSSSAPSAKWHADTDASHNPGRPGKNSAGDSHAPEFDLLPGKKPFTETIAPDGVMDPLSIDYQLERWQKLLDGTDDAEEKKIFQERVTWYSEMKLRFG